MTNLREVIDMLPWQRNSPDQLITHQAQSSARFLRRSEKPQNAFTNFQYRWELSATQACLEVCKSTEVVLFLRELNEKCPGRGWANTNSEWLHIAFWVSGAAIQGLVIRDVERHRRCRSPGVIIFSRKGAAVALDERDRLGCVVDGTRIRRAPRMSPFAMFSTLIRKFFSIWYDLVRSGAPGAPGVAGAISPESPPESSPN
ncbi:hypothetical protein B0H19DRAFT_1064183 [Mycena capillaripes]|nr:hypothetical protein B0H19DRAFT_1064183 [Mycena capillaripes]